ncbi:substrate-binding domain-containing protein [Novipirellula artificiosorum]|uniref:Putative binding protein n=1 Tax=Novipirellula artificiosorum TaxID=2528016 RepID=A0A5C6DSI3_9BACT|nr:substrate-binding domain-containing protein [Novipirellula artificiosorum]TWU39690.1 putative binding protein precursor [Novipirellula artificiosorum]
MMNRTIAVMLGSALLLISLLAMLIRGDGNRSTTSTSHDKPLMVYCAASNRAVMEQVRQAYEDEFQRSVQIQYGPSQTLLSSIEVTRDGDLYLPADDSFLEIGRSKQLVAEILPIASMQAVVAVSKGNPKSIATFADLQSSNVRLVQASPEGTAIGKVTKAILTNLNRWEELDRATLAYRGTVNEVANDISVGAADAGIVYDAVLHTYPGLEFLELPELSAGVSQVSIGVIASTQQPQAALHFARYLSARDRGLLRYAEHGFHTSAGDVWADHPSLSLFAGSMLRPAIEETITAFEEREGVSVDRVYNGCGILVAQMKGGQHPDAYFACDNEFMNQVHDLFPQPVEVSQNELVILVQKGNPLGIARLSDLARDGIRVGVGHEKQCAMGWLTQNTFREAGVEQSVLPNVTVQSPTGDMLVNQLRTKSLDAAVVYLSNAAGSADVLDAIRIDGLKCSIATQPWAVSKESRYPSTAERLFTKLSSADSKEIFAAEGFQWKIDPSKSVAE